MSTQDATDDAPPPTGPFFSTWGPLDGPIRGSDYPPAHRVISESSPWMPIGLAYPVGPVKHRHGHAKTFRLIIGGTELPGRWICDRRRFVLLGKAAEGL